MKEENQGVGVIESKRRSVSSWRVAQAGRQAKCQKRLYSFVFGFINMAVNFFFFFLVKYFLNGMLVIEAIKV